MMFVAFERDTLESSANKQMYFHKLKVGDEVKVPVKNRIRKVTVFKKSPYCFSAIMPNGCKEFFTIGDVITSIRKTVGSRVSEWQ